MNKSENAQHKPNEDHQKIFEPNEDKARYFGRMLMRKVK
mgnify:CR=1 FL=1